MAYKQSLIRSFKGLSQSLALTAGSPEYALSCVNVLPSSAGLAKLRIPPTLSTPPAGLTTGPDQFAMFSGSSKQVMAFFGQAIYIATLDDFTMTIIDSNADYVGLAPWSVQMANDFAFLQNGRSLPLKYTGTAPLELWGIVKPPMPTFGTAPSPGATPIAISAAATPQSLTLTGTAARTGNIATLFGSVTVSDGDTIQVSVPSDPTYDGIVTITLTGGGDPTYASNGPDGATSGGGTIIDFNQSGVSRINNQVQVITTAPHGRNAGDQVTIFGVTDGSFDGTFTIDSIVNSTTFTYAQVGVNTFSGGGTETPSTAPSYILGGRRYRISYANSVTGHVSSASDASAATGNLIGTIVVDVTCPASTDPQVDSAWLWSSLDGGGDYFFNQTISITPLTAPVFSDTLQDSQLDQSRRAPLINDVPPIAKFTCQWGGRMFLFNLPHENKKWVAYTGYNRIFIGRPEETCPSGNRIKMETGADEIAGGGVIDAGVIVFDNSHRMFMFRGQPEDITVDAPVEFTLLLKQLPWQIGCAGHFTIQSTKRGLVWLSSSLDIFLFDGQSQPLSIDEGAEPILRSVNMSAVANSRSAYWQYKARDWYVLGVPTGDSQDLNTLLIVDLEPNAEKNVGIFPLDIGVFQSLGTVEMQDGEQKLVIGQSGSLKELTVTPTTINGIEANITSTTGTLGAFWQSGYFGNDDPNTEKFMRWTRVTSDQSGMRIKRRMIRDDVTNPAIIEFQDLPTGGKFNTNKKARLWSHEVRFRDEDVSQNILQIEDISIPLAVR